MWRYDADYNICWLQLLDISSTTAGQTAAWFPFVFSFSIGFVCGLVAPHLYRRARSDQPSDMDAVHPIMEQAPADSD